MGEEFAAEEQPENQLGSDWLLKTGSSTALCRPVSYKWCTTVGGDCCNGDRDVNGNDSGGFEDDGGDDGNEAFCTPTLRWY